MKGFWGEGHALRMDRSSRQEPGTLRTLWDCHATLDGSPPDVFTYERRQAAILFMPLWLGFLCCVQPNQTVMGILFLIFIMSLTTLLPRGKLRLNVTQLQVAGKPDLCGSDPAWCYSHTGAWSHTAFSLSHSGQSVHNKPLQAPKGRLEEHGTGTGHPLESRSPLCPPMTSMDRAPGEGLAPDLGQDEPKELRSPQRGRGMHQEREGPAAGAPSGDVWEYDGECQMKISMSPQRY